MHYRSFNFLTEILISFTFKVKCFCLLLKKLFPIFWLWRYSPNIVPSNFIIPMYTFISPGINFHVWSSIEIWFPPLPYRKRYVPIPAMEQYLLPVFEILLPSAKGFQICMGLWRFLLFSYWSKSTVNDTVLFLYYLNSITLL